MSYLSTINEISNRNNQQFKEIFIEMNKGLVINEKTYLVSNEYKSLLCEMDEVYRCIRTLNVDDNLIEKIVFIFNK